MVLLQFPHACVIILFYSCKYIELRGLKQYLRHNQNPWERSGQYEGDIRLTARRDVDDLFYWPKGELPYQISNAFNSGQKKVILRSLAHVSNNTCIKIIPKRKSHNTSLYFTKQPGHGCSSYLGFQGLPRQPIYLDPGCVQFATVVHEILHALGMGHQHTSPFRDQYIVINWKNVIRGMEYNFVKHRRGVELDFQYDYDSIMHIDSYAFSANGMRTIEAVFGGDEKLGRTQRLSSTDIAKLTKIMWCWKLDVQNTFKSSERVFSLPNKLLVGAGPTNYSPRVLTALSNHSTSTICKELYQMMDDIRDLLKYVFQTKNEVTLALQNSGTGGLEAALTNLVDPGEKIIIAIGGVWGDRTVDKAKTRNIDVVKMVTKPGEVFTLEELEREIKKHKPVLLFITHGESSGGTTQPLEGLGEICHKYNCLLAVDAVVSLGGVPLFTDRWGLDVVVAATQKPIGAPPGLAFITLSPRAVERMKSLKTPPPFYYNILELCNVWSCFGQPRRYYYTYNSHMICAAREALVELAEEGLENVWDRHRKTAERFWKGLERLGLTHFIKNPEHRLWTVNLFHIPDKVKWPILVDYLLEKHHVVISFGIGPSYNKAFRIGIMGYNARPEVVDYVLDILEEGIKFCQSDAGQSGSVSRPEVL